MVLETTADLPTTQQEGKPGHGGIPTLTGDVSVSGQVAAVRICSGGGARRAGDPGIARPRPRPRAARRGLSFPVRRGRCTPRGMLMGCSWGMESTWLQERP